MSLMTVDEVLAEAEKSTYVLPAREEAWTFQEIANEAKQHTVGLCFDVAGWHLTVGRFRDGANLIWLLVMRPVDSTRAPMLAIFRELGIPPNARIYKSDQDRVGVMWSAGMLS